MNAFYRKILWHLPRKVAHTLLHYDSHKEIINWKNPKTYDEKIRWLLVNLYGENEAKYADKYKVRKYIKDCGLEEILIPIYGTWKSSKEINLEELPSKFILKANHGSGEEFYSIIENKNDKEKMLKEFKKIDSSLKFNFAKLECEYQYDKIEPRIIAEKYLEDNNKRLTDYKVLCFNSIPKYILVCSERNKGRDYFDINWNYMLFTNKEYRSKNKIPKPKNLERMLEYASIISKPFHFVRVDFYDLDGKIYFGEISLTPAACMNSYLTQEAQLKIGKEIQLPIK